jgi:hypothetical protein
MKTVKQKMVAMTVAILLGTVGTTPAGAGISVGFRPGAAGGTYVGEMSDSHTEPSLLESDAVSIDENIPSRPVQTSRGRAPVQRGTSQNTCDTNRKLAEIDLLMSRLKEVQADVKAGYQDMKAIAEFGGVVVKKLDALAKCTASNQTAKIAIAERYDVVEKILSQSVSQSTPKPKAGG